MKTLITNGTIISEDNEYIADILIEDEKIAMIGKKIAVFADKVIDASGKYVFPGGIDQHTHFDALCNVGDQDTAPYETTKAVIVGGTTSIVDFAPQDPGCGLLESIDYRINNRAKGKICVDFALHSLVTEVNDNLYEEIKELPNHGISSIKCFMAYKGSPLHVDDGTLYKVMRESKKVGVTPFVHTENADLIDTFQKDCIHAGKTTPRYHAESRPPFVETEAAQRAIYLAEQVGSPLFIVHITTEEVCQALRKAREKGLHIFGETCTQYLTITKEKLENNIFEEAAKYVCSPALRDKNDVNYMWSAIANGTISAIVSDHCGISLNMKEAGRNDFTLIPNGAPGAADRISVIWTKGVVEGRITKQKFVEVCSTMPAKINGIYPRKGVIAVGSDADIVIFDSNYHGKISLQENPNGVDYNIYEGTEIFGRPEIVLLRGNVVVEEAKFVGKIGCGNFIPSKPYAYCYGQY